ncbi:hypothetical protein Rhe02_45130 [Rhizocola hellebori]|uniref:DinB family protein n=2 Tax=Rhizocola hellebori TaxID=1392758 RepID=A0A8J3VHX4_9ACTN|nr:hypothetical protein Rhe02_45130 [Rhizocola hellebori]
MNDVQAVTRVRPPEAAPERETVTGLLDFLRATVVLKVSGLTDEQAFSASVPPSTLTPAGLIKHLTGVERFWFSIDFADADLPWPWGDENPGAFLLEPTDTIVELVAAYEAECARSNSVISSYGLDDMARAADMNFNLRYALMHMVEETARHCGHLDLLRERIDGVTGE